MLSVNHENFIRDGRLIGDWLRTFATDDFDRREAAHAALMSMRGYDVDFEDHPDFDMAARLAAWDAAVHRAAGEPRFDTAPFVRRLVRLMGDLQADRMAAFNRENERTDRVLDRIAAERNAPDLSPERKDTLDKRLRRVICSGCGQDGADEQRNLKILMHQVTAMAVFNALGDRAVAAPDVLRSMLADGHPNRHEALKLIERIGPAVGMLREDLFAGLARAAENHDWLWARALARVIGESDASPVARLVGLLDDAADARTSMAAAWTLAEIGPAAAGLAPGCVEKLIARTRFQANGDVAARNATIAALGRLGREHDAAVARLLEISREPDLWIRAAAISALGDVRHRPDLVVPRLIEAFDDFDEPNPDYRYESQHDRVATALVAFGPAAVAAVPALTARIRRGHSDGDMDRGVVEALGAIGPAAAVALPELERLFADGGSDESDLEEELSPLGKAMRSIRGENAT